MQQTQKVLTNGLNTLFINSPGSSMASVQIWFRAGSALENKKDFGIAHFLEHMFFKGTPKRPGAKIAREVESFGGEINAFTSFDYTCYYINTPSNKLQKTIEILLDMVSNPMFEESELIPERDVVHEEFRRSLDSPNQYNFKSLQETSFTKGYSHQILGTEKNILSFSREQLIQFREKFYNLSNSMFLIAGDIKNQTKLEAIINKFKLPEGPKSKFSSFQLQKDATTNIHNKHVNQTTMTIVIQAPEYDDKEGASEDLAVNCLAHGEISPLYQKLVTETNIASSSSGSTMFFAKGGAHFLKFAFPTENFSKVTKQLSKIIQDVIEKGLTENEITRIKNQYIASKIYERESIESHAFSLGHGFAQSGDINCEEDFIENIRNTSTEEVNRSLKNLLSRNLHITIQHPTQAKIKNLQKELDKLREDIKKTATKVSTTHKRELVITSDYDPEVKVFELKKGVKLIYRQNKLTPTFVLHAYLKGGLAHENKNNNGHYYFLSRLLTYGYKGLDFNELKMDLENKSSYLNGFSGKNAYGLTLHGLSDSLGELLKHFEQSLFNPTIPKQYLDLEKELVKRTIENQKEDSLKQCFTQVSQVVFNGHPYSMPVFGESKGLKGTTREKLLSLHRSRLENSEIVFTYCGDENIDTIKDKILKMTDQLAKRSKEKKLNNKVTPIFGVEKKLEFDREQTQVFIGRPAYKSQQKDDLYLKLLTSYLSGQSSELFVEVRDRKGLCYAVQPIQHTALEAGYWGIYIGAGAEKTQLAKTAILDILNKLRDKGLSKSEFNRVKTMIDGQNRMSIQTNDDYANFYSISVLHELGLDYQHKTFKEIEGLEHEAFNKFLKKFLKTKWNIIEAGKSLV